MSCGCGSQLITVPCEQCGGGTTILPPTNCRQPLASTDIAALVWLQGLDANNCFKFQQIADALQLLACDGSLVNSATPLVTCTLFQSKLCTTLTELPTAGLATSLTKLVGADCQTYTLPPAAVGTPLTVLDTTSIDLTLTPSQVLSGAVIVSPNAGNQLVANVNGLFVPAPPSAITVQDTPCIDLILTGSVLSAAPVISANICNALSCSGDGLLVTEHTSAGLMTAEVVQYDAPLNEPTVLDLPLITLQITNPSTCRQAVLSIHLQTPAICSQSVDPVQTTFQLLLQRFLSPVYVEAEFVLTQTSFNGANDSDAPYDRGWVYTVPPNFSGTVTARLRVSQNAGNLLNLRVVSPVLRYHLSTI